MDVFADMNMDLELEEGMFESSRLQPPVSEGRPAAPEGFVQVGEDAEGIPFDEEDTAYDCEEDGNEENQEEAAGQSQAEIKEGDAADGSTEECEKAEHEAAEAERRAEWEARQQAKKSAEREQLAKIESMDNEALMSEAMKRVGADTEKLTRRNMKDCVAEYVQTLCLEDPGFARMVMHPRKTMINCFHYINRKAKEFIQQEMEDNDIKPENGVYGSDVPDDLCYQWAEDYFRDPDAKEDRAEEEKFVPKPYVGRGSAKAKPKKNTEKKGTAKKPAGKKTEKPKQEDGQMSFIGQMSLGDLADPEVKAG
ncbi:MAG: PcfK-like family protein [Lachnospiraceae bacterium]|nr:PcfK-like family protein [Lachnospiraceae bacterium]MCM1239378.1 PcfK-like family protein [Lachnospiraceae bacterium]